MPKEGIASTKSHQSDTISLHRKQGEAFESNSKITLCCSGIQGGKSTVGALWALKNSFGWDNGDAAIIAAPTYKILNQSTLPTWLRYAGRFGHYNKADQEFIFHDGFKAYIRTSTEPDSIEGIQNVRWIWGDEAGKLKYQFWINAEGRAARTNAPLFLTTTPYGLNWLYQSLIKPFKDGERSDIAYFEWLSIDNPSFPKEEYERQRLILDARTFRRKYMGLHERMEGLVYELSSDHRMRSISLPPNTRYFASVDWGHSEGHEFAISVRGITLDGFQYAVDEFKQAGLDPNQQVEACRAKKSIWNIELFGCDPSRPDMISLLNKTGCRAMGFHEGQENYKPLIAGITLHTALLRSGKYRLFEDRVPHMCDEYETYHWPEFQEDKIAKEEPVKMNDHLMDCERMLTVLTKNIVIRGAQELFLGAKLPHIDNFDPRKPSKKKKNWDSY